MITYEDINSERTEKVRQFFDQSQHYLDRRKFDIRVRAETVVDLLKEDDSFTQILDIGCGDGSISIPLLSPQRHLTLLDISTNMLANASARVPVSLTSNVRCVNADFLVGIDNSERYDLVICIGVLAHVSSPVEVVDKIAGLLNPGGILIVEFTDSTHFLRRLLSLYHASLGLFRRSLYTANSYSGAWLLDVFTKRGFTLKAQFRYGFPWPGIHRVMSQKTLYRMVKSLFGSAKQNKNRWLGSEYICCFRLL
jgi:ubiquinone/menaquinone biosynthesis C-methylase UbiE